MNLDNIMCGILASLAVNTTGFLVDRSINYATNQKIPLTTNLAYRTSSFALSGILTGLSLELSQKMGYTEITVGFMILTTSILGNILGRYVLNVSSEEKLSSKNIHKISLAGDFLGAGTLVGIALATA